MNTKPFNSSDEDPLYRLEYNPKQGGFHFDNYTHEANTYGWHTIHPMLRGSICSEFADEVQKKFPSTDWTDPKRDIKRKPSLITVLEMFYEFSKINNL